MSEQGPETEGKIKGGDAVAPNEEEQPVSAESDQPTEVEAKGKPKAENGQRRRRLFIIGGSVLVIAAIVGLAYWLYARQFESTDDAFIDGDIVQVSPKVAAYVTKVYVKSNQYVHKGDPLVDLDPQDLNVKLEQAQAQLANAKSQKGAAEANVGLTAKTTGAGQNEALSNVQTSQTNVRQTQIAADSRQKLILQARAVARTAQASLAQARAQVPQAESNVHLARVEYDRRLALYNHGDISKQSLDQGTNALQTAESQLDAQEKAVLAAQSRVDEANAAVAAAEQNYNQALAQVDVTRSQVNESKGRLEDANAAPERVDVSQAQVDTADAGIAAAEAAVHEAELELSYTKIVAPEAGYVTRKTAEEGQLVAVGTPLMAISQSDEIWVVANFKETQLENMQIGQSVSIKIDAYPGKSFQGKVDSFQVGTGSRFSVLPAENATGNFVKVVQRIPVKIVFDKQPENVVLAPGMSAEPSVKVR
jgi:membrane fusion protein, multidrug efflux system